jgi:hypothetical protein
MLRWMMNRVIVDPATLARLRDARQTLELCDDSGLVVGHFVPALDPSERARLEPQVSEEELDRRLRAGGGRSLAEILTDLEKRP